MPLDLHRRVSCFVLVAVVGCGLPRALAQAPRASGGPGGGPGPGGELLKTFDKNGSGRLEADERKAAREFLAREIQEGRGPRRPGPPGMRGGGRPGGGRGGPGAPSEPAPAAGTGRKLTPADVKAYPDAGPFEDSVLRTIFVEFESRDWEAELGDFYHTDVDVPAKVTIDGREYPGVGVHFRGASSFFTVGEGLKRSLNLAFGHTRKDLRFHGIKTLNLLNAHTDPTYMRSMLYLHVAAQYGPAARANLVRVVINGESWGIYVGVEQVDGAFLKDRFETTAGHRWKVPGSPRGRGTLAYLGDEPEPYRRIYALKSKEDPAAWKALIRFCRILEQTPPDQLEAALEAVLDVDGALEFLALENVFINNDGYWIRNSDYNLYLDARGRFHFLPHDTNETFRDVERGPGSERGARASGVELDPLAGVDNPGQPLLNKLLAVPALRARYLAHVRTMAETWLDWNRVGPLATRWRDLIAADVQADVHKLYSAEAFAAGFVRDAHRGGGEGFRGSISLPDFCERRRAYLLTRLGELTATPAATPVGKASSADGNQKRD